MGVKIFFSNYPPKTYLGIEGFKKINFEYLTPYPDSGIQCVDIIYEWLKRDRLIFKVRKHCLAPLRW